MLGAFVPKNFDVSHFTSLQNKITSQKSRQFTPHQFTYLHSIATPIPLLVTTFLTLFLNVFIWQGKDASKTAGNWWMWKTVWVIMPGKTRGTRRKSCPGATLSTTNFTYTALGSNRYLDGVRTNINLHCIEIFISYRAVNTPQLDPKTDNLMFYWDMLPFCSEIHKTRHKICMGRMQNYWIFNQSIHKLTSNH